MATELHIVSGKGGTGKTTVAAALAAALAGRGRKVLLCEVEGRQGLAQLFDVAPLPYAEKRIAVGLDGGHLWAIAIDPEAALLEYLQMFYKLGRAGKALDRFGVIDFATTIAPGVRDVLLTGKVYEAAKRRSNDRYVYDAVVLDAPPTGRITRFLNVNSEVAGLAKVGPVKRQADSIMSMLHADTTRVHLTTVLEQMPVQETLDGVAELTEAGLPVGSIIVNQVRPSPFDEAQRARLAGGEPNEATIASTLDSVGLEPGFAATLLRDGADHVARQTLQAEQAAALADSGQPVVRLPHLSEGIDLGALYELADVLRKEIR